MCLIAFALSLSLISIILRPIVYKSRSIPLNKYYYFILGISLIGTIAGLAGFKQLSEASVDKDSGIDYSQILTVLSLLAAAVITGFFTFSYTEAASDEWFLPSAISACFSILFYVIFGALSFYMGKSSHVHNAPYANFIGSVVMWMLLVVNALFDFWDYRDGS